MKAGLFSAFCCQKAEFASNESIRQNKENLQKSSMSDLCRF